MRFEISDVVLEDSDIVQKRFLLRLSPELYAQLERWAADELRSVNGQIEFALRQAVEARRKKTPTPAPAPEGKGSGVQGRRSA